MRIKPLNTTAKLCLEFDCRVPYPTVGFYTDIAALYGNRSEAPRHLGRIVGILEASGLVKGRDFETN